MRAGRLRHRLYLQTQSLTQDGYGGGVPTWTHAATVWGSVETLYGTESFTADKIQGATQVRIIIRYGSEWAAISNAWRVKDVDSGKCYDIQAVIDAEHRYGHDRTIELLCNQGSTDDE